MTKLWDQPIKISYLDTIYETTHDTPKIYKEMKYAYKNQNNENVKLQ